MLLAEYNGPAFGLGAARTLVQGTDFNCNQSICYGIGAANHELFKQLQMTLNTYARLGVSAYRNQLTVDGFLGDQTLTAARSAAAAALLPAPSTKPQLATQAAVLNEGLQAFLAPKPAPTPAPSAPVATTTTVPATPTSIPGVMTVPTAPTAPRPTAIPTAVPITTAAVPTATAVPGALTPITPPKAKTPTWVWIVAGVAGVVVVGGVGYALLREPEPRAAFGAGSLPLRTYDLYWGPTGQRITTVRAVSAHAAIRKTPRPYSKYKGEVYAEYVR